MIESETQGNARGEPAATHEAAECRIDLVRLNIARLVFRGALRIGDVLPSERHLVAMYGVHRGALRRALVRLLEDGVIRVSHGRRTMVTGSPRPGGAPLPVRADRTRSDPARASVERVNRWGQAGENRCGQRGAKAVASARMNLLVGMQRETDEVPQFVIADQLFCAEVASACDPQSAGLIRQLAEQLATAEHRAALEDASARREVVTEYRAISAAFERGDAGSASAATCRELQRRVRAHAANRREREGDVTRPVPMDQLDTDLQGVLMAWHG